jgi:hypothetical protein
MKKILSVLFVLAVLIGIGSTTTAFASTLRVCGGGQIHESVAYPMVDTASDGYMAEYKTAAWLTKFGNYYGYRNGGVDGSMYSVIASGSVTYVGIPATVVPKIVWSTKALNTPTVTFTENANGAILSATITAHESVSYKSKRATYWRHHHKHVKTVKVKVVTRSIKFGATPPSALPAKG